MLSGAQLWSTSREHIVKHNILSRSTRSGTNVASRIRCRLPSLELLPTLDLVEQPSSFRLPSKPLPGESAACLVVDGEQVANEPESRSGFLRSDSFGWKA
jgi:hypothetical protein